MRHLCLLMVCFVSLAASARTGTTKDFVEGFFKTSSGRKIYYKYYPGTNLDEAIVPVNGLTQDTEHWSTTVPEMLKSGKSVVLFDTFNQGRSLENYVDENEVWKKIGSQPLVQPLLGEKMMYAGQKPLIKPAPVEKQAEDLAELLQFLKVRKSTLVGLSYGGALALQYAAMYPRRVSELVLVAPYIEPMAEQDQLIKFYIGVFQRTYPLMDFDEEELYDWLLRGLVLSTYYISEPTSIKWGPMQPYAVAQLASGVRHLSAAKLVKKLNSTKIHLVLAGNDAYIKRPMMMEFWESIPEELRASLTVVNGVEHKINESVGPFLGGLVRLFAAGKPALESGNMWVGYPEKGLLESKDGKSDIQLPRTAICENFLRPTLPNQPNLPVDRIQRNPAEIFIHGWRAMLPPAMRKYWDQLTAFWI